MVVNKEIIDYCKIKLSFKLEKERFNKALDESFKQYIQNNVIPGFRKGAVPFNYFIKHYGIEVLYDDTIQKMIQEAFDEYDKTRDFNIYKISETIVNNETIGSDKELEFSIIIDSSPDIELKQYKGLEVEAELPVITNKEFDDFVNNILDENPIWELVENTTLERGDIGVFFLAGFINANIIPELSINQLEINTLTESVHPEIVDQIIGMSYNQIRRVDIKMNDQEYTKKGQIPEYYVKLLEVYQPKRPTLDDDFIQNVLQIEDINNVNDFSKFVIEILQKQKQKEIDNKINHDLIEKLLIKNPFIVPKAYIDDQINTYTNQIKIKADNNGKSLDEYILSLGYNSLDDLVKSQENNFYKKAKTMILFPYIAAYENLEVSNEECELEYQKLAKETNHSVEEIKKLMHFNQIYDILMDIKVFNVIRSNAIIKTKRS